MCEMREKLGGGCRCWKLTARGSTQHVGGCSASHIVACAGRHTPIEEARTASPGPTCARAWRTLSLGHSALCPCAKYSNKCPNKQPYLPSPECGPAGAFRP